MMLIFPLTALADPAVDSGACGVAAVTEYNAVNLALMQREPILSIESRKVQRRLEENFCEKYAHCIIDGLPISPNPSLRDLPLRAEFSQCLEDQSSPK
jgi:hypothetical protein